MVIKLMSLRKYSNSDSFEFFTRQGKIIVWAFFLLFLFYVTAHAQKRKPVQAKRKPVTSQKGKQNKGPSKSGFSAPFYIAELGGGMVLPTNSGTYFDYQRQYYATQNPSFSIEGSFPRRNSFTAYGSFHAGITLNNSFIRFVAAGLSFSWSDRILAHEVTFVNNGFNFRNRILISESYRASYISPEFQVRFGAKVYGLLGIRRETLISGSRERKLRSESDSVQSGSPIEKTDQWNLRNSDLVRPFNWGYHAAIGYMPVPWAGIRFGYVYNGTFFRTGPDFSTHQYYFGICFGLVK
jgi:hypothetical protein